MRAAESADRSGHAILGSALGGVSVVFTSIGVLVNKFALIHVGPVPAAALNAGFAFVFCGVALLLPRLLGRTRVGMPPMIPMLLLLAAFNAAGLVLLFALLDLSGPIVVGFLGRMYIVFAILISVIAFGERHSRLEYLLMALSVAAAAAFTIPDSAIGMGGFLLAVSYCVLFALANAVGKVMVGKSEQKGREGALSATFSMLAASNLLAFMLVSVLFLAGGWWTPGSISLPGVGWVALASMSGTVLGVGLFYYSLKFASFSNSTVMRSLQPLVVAAISWPFFPVEVTWFVATGGVLMLLSVFCLIFIDSRKETNIGTGRSRTQ